MRVQVRSDHIVLPGESIVPSVLAKLETGIRLLRPRLLEIAVGGLLALWWLKMFGLGVTFLQEAATMGLSLPL